MSASLQQIAYQLLLRLLLPLFIIKTRKQDPERWLERLGYYPEAVPSKPIWLHAASYGEAKAAGLLIEAMRTQGYQGHWFVTTTTRTGGDAIKPYLCASDCHRYAPFDLPGSIRRVLTRVKPQALIVMEVEIWPNLWRACQQQQVPIVLANARLSETSAKRYRQLLPQLWRSTLGRASKILAQSQLIAERFERLGANADRIQVCGNLKYALEPNPDIIASGQQLRQLLGRDRPVWLAASTHSSEEQLVIDCHKRLLEHHPDLLLVIAPRHPQRFDTAWQLCTDSDLNTQRRSHHPQTQLDDTTQLYLADTLGELLLFFAASDLCLVAGSFVNVGGHNILEPANYDCPIIVGPDMKNFSDIHQDFMAREAIVQASSPSELYPCVKQLLDHKPQGLQLAQNAKTCLHAYQDAASQQAKAVLEKLYTEPAETINKPDR